MQILDGNPHGEVRGSGTRSHCRVRCGLSWRDRLDTNGEPTTAGFWNVFDPPETALGSVSTSQA